MAVEYQVMNTTGGNYQDINLVYPYPWPSIPIPYQWPNTYVATWPSVSDTRIAALEARLAKLERENQRLKRGLGRLYREHHRQRQQTEAQ